ncbi:MAG: hypothetical protein U0935_21430 [Pirellulales bacterium]
MSYYMLGPAGVIWLLLGMGVTWAHDLELTMRLHTGKVQAFDPLFIEVTLLNKGREPIVVNKPEFDMGTLRIQFLDNQRDISVSTIGGPGWDKAPQMKLEPNRPVVVRDYLFLPGVRWREHAFWKKFADGGTGSLTVTARYSPDSRGVVFTSNSESVDISYRIEEETRAILSQLGDVEPDIRDSVAPDVFDLPLFGLRDSRRTRALADQIERGDFKELLLLVAQMQEIREHDAAARKEADQRLVAWLLERPNVKGRVLTEKALAVARQYRLTSTADALGRIELDPRSPFDR